MIAEAPLPPNHDETATSLPADLVIARRPHRVTLDIAPEAIAKVVLTAVALYVIVKLLPVLLLIVFSLMLVATFNPLVRKLQARFGRTWAIAGLVTGIVLLFLGILALMIPTLIHQGIYLFENAPRYAGQIEDLMAQYHIPVKIQKRVASFVDGSASLPLPIFGLLSSAVALVTGFITVAILSIYLLIEGPDVMVALMRSLPREERFPVRRLLGELGAQVGGYMRGQIITSGLTGVFSFLTLWLIGVPGALALAALAAIADAIPLIGVLIALVPASLMALTISPAKALLVIVAYTLYHQVEANFIAPKVYGKSLSLSLTVIVISLLIGVQLMGMAGAILALPAAAAVRTLYRFNQQRQERQEQATV